MAKRIVFFHIPKTAGTSVNVFFMERMARDSVLINPGPGDVAAVPWGADLYLGAHMDWDLYDSMPGNHKVFTFLRDPQAALLSAYYFLRTFDSADADGVSAEVRAADSAVVANMPPGDRAALQHDLSGWLDYCLEARGLQGGAFANTADNGYTRMMLGIARTGALPRLEFDEDGPEMMLARQRLRRFDCIGLVDRFEDSLRAIAVATGVAAPTDAHFRARNRTEDQQKTAGMARREEITPEIQDKLDALTRYDRLIYAYGRELAAEQRRAYGIETDTAE